MMNQNQSFTDKNLAALAAIMLLAPIVAFMLREKSIDISAEEEGFVRSYLRYGYWIIMIVILALLVWATYSLFFDLTVLYWINYTLLGIAIAMILIGVFSIINNKMIFTHQKFMTTGSEQIHHDTSVISYFIPLYNYYMWYNEPLDEHTYRWIKESILWWSIYLILISIWPTASLIAGGFFIIVARMIMLAAGMDIISTSAKHKLNELFAHNIEELIAYPLALITNIIKKIFQQKSSLATEIASRKLTYAQLDTISHWRTIVQYLIAAAAIGYRGYTTRMTSGPTVGVNLALLPQILWIGKILMTITSGKLPRIPILYSLLGGKKNNTNPINNT